MTTLFVKEDPQTGDLYLDLTEKLCNEMGWTVGDVMLWEDRGDGSWSLRKKDDVLAEKEENSN